MPKIRLQNKPGHLLSGTANNQLPKLTDIKTYIDANHRKPEMPSEEQTIKTVEMKSQQAKNWID
ncbi:MAG: hypothetical protein ACHQHN_07965 [Sphingobacteriales bacterium]